MTVLQEIVIPQEDLSDDLVLVKKFHFKNGENVSKGTEIIDLETSKTAIILEAEDDGYLHYLCEEGEELPIGAVIAKIFDKPPEEVDKRLAENAASGEDSHDLIPEQSVNLQPKFSKAALTLIEKEGIDRERFNGSDFVDSKDVLRLLGREIPNNAAPQSPSSDPGLIRTNDQDSGSVEYESLSYAKKAEIKYLSEAQAPGLTSVINVVVDRVGDVYGHVNQSAETLKESILPLITFEVSRLLKKYPALNAFYAGERIGLYKEIHIGIAIDIDDGLKVVKIPHTDALSFRQVEAKIIECADKYLDKKLEVRDLSGTTFTITDLSAQGAHFFSPLVNARQSAILGVSAVDEKLDRITLTLTFDHRVTEGKVASSFLSDLKNRLENHGSTQRSTKHLVCDICMKTLSEDQKLRGVGFVKIVNHNGEEKAVCRVCFAGW